MASTLRDDGRRGGARSREDSPAGAERERGKDRAEEQGQAGPVKSSHIITEHIDVGVPAMVAFDQWMQFDKWSDIFKAESADAPNNGERNRTSENQVHVRSKIGPSNREWAAEVVEVDPGKRVRWRSKGPLNGMGTTSFHSLDDRLTAVMVQVEYHPRGLLEIVGNFFRMQRRRVRRDLRLFKHYIEMRGKPTGGGPRRAAGDGLRGDVDGEGEG